MEKLNLLRKVFILLFVALFTGLVGFNAQAKVTENDYTDGEWKDGKKSISNERPTISIDGTLLMIQSTNDRSDITINISNDSGFFYNETVPSANTHLITIDLSDAPKGVYRLDLTNQWGGHLFGNFEIR